MGGSLHLLSTSPFSGLLHEFYLVGYAIYAAEVFLITSAANRKIANSATGLTYGLFALEFSLRNRLFFGCLYLV